MPRQPISPTLIVSLGGVADEMIDDESALANDGIAIPAVSAAVDLINDLLLMVMMLKIIGFKSCKYRIIICFSCFCR
jgi:hypothetical protein